MIMNFLTIRVTFIFGSMILLYEVCYMFLIKVKVKFTLEQAKKAKRESRCITLLFL